MIYSVHEMIYIKTYNHLYCITWFLKFYDLHQICAFIINLYTYASLLFYYANIQMEDVVVVLDNALVPSGIKSVVSEEEFLGAKILRSPYIPLLNPIETVWCAVNCKLKISMAEHVNVLIFSDTTESLTQSKFQLRSHKRKVCWGSDDYSFVWTLRLFV